MSVDLSAVYMPNLLKVISMALGDMFTASRLVRAEPLLRGQGQVHEQVLHACIISPLFFLNLYFTHTDVQSSKIVIISN